MDSRILDQLDSRVHDQAEELDSRIHEQIDSRIHDLPQDSRLEDQMNSLQEGSFGGLEERNSIVLNDEGAILIEY